MPSEFPPDHRLNDHADMSLLFEPIKIGALSLPHRIVMAPLTRSRAGSIRTPNDMMVRYYGQRAGAAMIISEATIISPTAAGYAWTPGIYNAEQVAGWKKITKEVHDKGGRIICQLWHCGRVSHPDLLPEGVLPVGPSANVPRKGQAFTETGFKDFVDTHALETAEIKGVIVDYVQAAKNAKEAGFDGIEVHGANGYLLEQFLYNGVNTRSDEYGGSIENRARFMLEVLHAVLEVWPADRVGVRISPWGGANDMHGSDIEASYEYLAKKLNDLDLAYLSLVERSWAEGEREAADAPPSITAFIRQFYDGAILSAGGFGAESAASILQAGDAQLVAFGKLYISNPDLVERLRAGHELAMADPASFYGGGEEGYTDYPFMGEAAE